MSSGKALALLAYVLLHRDAEVSRDAAAFALWPDHPENEARANLRRTLYRLQHDLPEGSRDWIAADARSLSWNSKIELWFDVEEFKSRLQSGEHFDEAVNLYRGDLLPSLDDEWLVSERESLRELFIKGLLGEAGRCLRTGNYSQGIDCAKRALQIDPWREDAFRSLFTLRVKSGDRSGALREYQTFEAELKRELGASPMAETQELVTQVLHGAPIGEEAPSNLPAQLTSFVGRDQDLAELRSLVTKSRLVTLVGPGGIGKTRLSVQAANSLRSEFKDGVWFIDLASVSETPYIVSTIASALGISAASLDRPLQETLITAIQKRQMLIVLDNCEQIIPALAPIVVALLQTCSGIRMLCTSREPLKTEGEDVMRLSGLPEADAVRLFMERARAADKHFETSDRNVQVTAEICRRLDGIPLAIELAAPRASALSLRRLQQRLDEHFRILTSGNTMTLPRHKTMHALIDWSYDLLSPEEQRLLRVAGVFVGGFTLEAAAALYVDAPNGDAVLDLLSSLIAKSLVQIEADPERERYSLLQITQQYALEKLDEAGELADARERHGQHFLNLAKAADETHGSANAREWLQRYRLEMDNMRTAVEHCYALGDTLSGAALIAAMRELWLEIGPYAEGLHRAERAVQVLGDDAPLAVRAGLWLTIGQLGNLLYLTAHARESSQKAADAFETLKDESHLAYALQTLGFSLIRSGLHDEAESMLVRAQTLAEQRGNRRVIARALLRRAHNASATGEAERALPLYERCLQISRTIEDDLYVGYVLGHLAIAYFRLGDLPHSASYGREAQEIFQRRKDAAKESNALANLAETYFAQGDFTQAKETARTAIGKALESESTVNALQALQHLAAIAAAEQHSRKAARLIGYADAVYGRLGTVFGDDATNTRDQAMESLQEQLTHAELQGLLNEGAALSADEAYALAVSEP